MTNREITKLKEELENAYKSKKEHELIRHIAIEVRYRAKDAIDEFNKLFGEIVYYQKLYGLDWESIHKEDLNEELEFVALTYEALNHGYDALLETIEKIQDIESKMDVIFGGDWKRITDLQRKIKNKENN